MLLKTGTRGDTVTKLVQIGTELRRVENYLFFEGLLPS